MIYFVQKPHLVLFLMVMFSIFDGIFKFGFKIPFGLHLNVNVISEP